VSSKHNPNSYPKPNSTRNPNRHPHLDLNPNPHRNPDPDLKFAAHHVNKLRTVEAHIMPSVALP